MTYSLDKAALLAERSPATLRRAIKAGQLKASKDERHAYRFDHSALEAWLGRLLEAPGTEPADDLEALRAELVTARAEIDHQRQMLEVQADALTLARQSAELSLDGQKVLAVALDAVTQRLQALSAGRKPLRWPRRARKSA